MSVYRVRWSRRVWAAVIGLSSALGIGFYLASDKPWWTAVLVGGILLAMIYTSNVRNNIEWEGYTPCKACRGTGRVPEDES